MKIKKEHMDIITEKLDKAEKSFLSWQHIWEGYKQEGLSFKRFCFDLTYEFIGSKWICDNLYSYMNDDHLYSAMKSYMRKKGIK